ncbi:MAG: BACON domain-containing protein [Bacteroidales bacterium]|nr:BACON domain-containing protein [Bacteroidales bacterium]
MKKAFFLCTAVVLAMLSAASCEETGDNPAPVLGLTPKEISVPPEGGTVSLSFTAVSAWSVSSGASWIKIQPESGEAGDVVLRASADANDTGAPRSTSITVRLTDGSASDQAAVSQSPLPEPPTPSTPDPVGGITGDIGGWDDGGQSDFE